MAKSSVPKTPKKKGNVVADANGGPTDNQLQEAFLRRKAEFVASEKNRVSVNQAHRNLCGRIKNELGDGAIDTIKDMVAMDTPEGEERVKKELARKAAAMRYMAAPLGKQFAMILEEPDRTPAEDQAFELGKRDGMVGLALRSPYAPELPQNDRYIEGWHVGNKTANDAKRDRDAQEFQALEAEQNKRIEEDGIEKVVAEETAEEDGEEGDELAGDEGAASYKTKH